MKPRKVLLYVLFCMLGVFLTYPEAFSFGEKLLISRYSKMLDDRDTIPVNVSGPGVLMIEGTVGEGRRHYFRLYDPAGERIKTGYFAEEYYFDELVCSAGTYTLVVNRSDGISHSPSIKLSTDDIYECNNSFETAITISLCDTVQAKIIGEEDKDFFSFNGVQGEELTLEVAEVPQNTQIDLDIYDADKDRIGDYNGSTGEPYSWSFTPEYTGEYFVRVNANQPADAFYRLIIANDNCSSEDCEVNDISVLIKHFHQIPEVPLYQRPKLLKTIDAGDLPQLGGKTIQVCADGTAASLIEFSFSGQDYSCIDDLDFQVWENDTRLEDERLKGKFILSSKNDGVLTYRYTHPDWLNTTKEASKEFTVIAKYDEKTVVEFTLQVWRPAVLMVHGWLSNGNVFFNLTDEIDGNLFFDDLYPPFF